MLRNGKYIEAQYLLPGDSLMSLDLKNHKLVVKDKNNQEMNIMNNNLIKILNKDNFTEQDYKVVLDSIIDNNFNELKLFLFD